MTESTVEAIGELERMTVKRLRERYAEVFDEASRSGNRRWLQRRIAWRLQALEEGDLTERARRRAAELARDADLRVRPPSGEVSVWGGQASAESQASGLRTVSGKLVLKRDSRIPPPGAVLMRVHKGIEHRVTVLPRGFEHDGVVHRSLSAVAHAITGSHWNGMLFFGLSKAGRARSKGSG